MRTFAAIPPYVEHLFTGAGEALPGLPDRADRVVVILLDAFGRVFRERFADHPLVRRMTVCELASQFPSTTTAHVTTMHSGLPVGRHGLYEWNVYEPSLDRIIRPLPFGFATGESLDGFIEPAALVPDEPCLYERLAARGVVSSVYQPSSFSPSTFDRAAIRGAAIRPYEDVGVAVADALRTVRAVDRGYAYVYFDMIDTTGHVFGPSSPEFAAAVRSTLDTIAAALVDAGDVLVLMTADHGQVDVDPERTVWLDDLHPPLAEMRLRPAGSARDVFLHVEDVDACLAALSPHIEVHRSADLFPEIGPRLRSRLAPVCVLPPPDRMAWVRGASDYAPTNFRGHHGGRTPEETGTYLAAVAT